MGGVKVILVVIVCFLSTLMAPPTQARIAGSDDAPRIDIHTHVFNFHYLPLVSLLRSRQVPRGVASAVGGWLESHTHSDGAEFAKDANESEPLSRAERALIADYLGDAPPMKGRYQLLAEEADEELVIRTLREAGFAVDGDAHSEADLSAKGLSLVGWGKFVRELMLPETQIASDLRRTYSQGEGRVSLFIHHMMDMQQAYGGSPPRFLFERQVARMHALTRQSEGALLTFVAYDPFRHAESFQLIQKAVAAGALGVKIYPPSGYRPTANETVPRPKSGFARAQWDATHGRVSPSQLDANLRAVFVWAQEQDVPLFTHCTSKGFEAHADAGLKASPEYWAQVLAEFPRLRLCFGHAGGHPGWFARKTEGWEESYARGVVELCRDYDNVYAGVGFLDGVLHARKRRRFQRRLGLEVGLKPGGAHDLGKKLLYGTDWHMSAKVKGHESFPEAFGKVMEAPRLVRYREAFFAGNAVRFLDLPRYLRRIEALAEDSPVDAAGRSALRTLVVRVESAEARQD